MQAVVIDAYGPSDRLQLREVDRPEPGPGQVLIRVRAASVNPIDWKTREGKLRAMLRLSMPTVLGVDVAGEVEAVGPAVTRLKVGDAVFAMLDPRAGRGSYAEYTTADESATALKPEGLGFEEAAAIPCAGLTALQSLRDLGGLASGGSALINGASGGVGSFAVQVARALGANVAGVCGAGSQEFVRGLGADPVLDYARDDYARRPERYDVVLDAAAASSFTDAAKVLKPRGVYVTTLPMPGALFWSAVGAVARLFGPGKRAKLVMARPRAADLDTLGRWAAEGKVRPVVAEVFPLAETKAAHDRSEAGQVRGKIAIRVD